MYHTHMQPSEVDDLTTYEFEHYIKHLKDYLKSDRERELDLAKISSVGRIPRQTDNIS